MEKPGGWFSNLGNSISNGWDSVTNSVGNAWNAGTELAGNTWDSVTDFAGNAWNAGTELAGNAWSDLRSSVNWEFSGSIPGTSRSFDYGSESMFNGVEYLGNLGAGVVTGAAGTLWDGVTEAVNLNVGLITEPVTAVSNIYNGTINGIQYFNENFSEIITGPEINSPYEFGQALGSFGTNLAGGVVGGNIVRGLNTVEHFVPDSLDDTIKLHHQGDLSNGIDPSRSLSTSTSPNLNHYHPEGQLYEFNLPRRIYYEWLDNNTALPLNDLHRQTGIQTPEIRIYPPSSSQMNQYLNQ